MPGSTPQTKGPDNRYTPISIQTPQAPESLDDLLRSPHNPAYTNGALSSHEPGSSGAGSPGSPVRDPRRWNGFYLWRTESEDAKRARQRRAIQEGLGSVEPPSRWRQVRRTAATKLRSMAPTDVFSIYRQSAQVDFRSDHLHTDDDDAEHAEPDGAEASLTSIGLMALTISLAGAQLAWTLELAYGTPYLLSLGLKEQSTSLVWLAGPLSGLIAQPVIGSLSDKSTSRFRRRRYMVLSAFLLTVSTLVLAYSVPLSILLVDLFGGGLADWDPHRDQLVHTTTQYIGVLAFWILDFVLNGLQASSRALILDVAPGSQQSVANAWHGRMTHAGNVVGYLCGWLDLGRWKGLRWLGGGQFRRFAVVSLLGMLSCVIVTVTAIREKIPARRAVAHQPSLYQQARETVDNVWQTMRRLPRPVRRVCMVQLFAYMGWFPFLFYSTTFVLQMDKANARRRAHAFAEKGGDEKAERGSFAMLMFAIVALVSGTLLPYLSLARERRSGGIALDTTTDGSDPDGPFDSELEASMRAIHGNQPMTLGQRIRRGLAYGLTLRTLWTIASIFFAALMLVGTFFVETVQHATLLIALVGLPWSVASWAPFAMVAEFVREAEDGQSPFEFDGDHWSPRRTQARVKARRRSSLLRRGEFTRERRRSVLEDNGHGQHDAKSRLNAALMVCQPLGGPSQSPARESVAGSFISRGGESVASLRPVHQVRTETGLTVETEEVDWEHALIALGGEEDEEAKFGGTILGIHNLAIVAPQFIVALIGALIFRAVEEGRDKTDSFSASSTMLVMMQGGEGGSRPADGVAWVLRFGGMMSIFAALATRFVPLTATERRKRGELAGEAAADHHGAAVVDRLVDVAGVGGEEADEETV